MMAELEERIDNPEFIFENIARASKAARGINHHTIIVNRIILMDFCS
jgi:hypothetical protein